MASGYIGKISAVVTANTSDLSRKLQGSVKDVDNFAKAIQKSVNGSAAQAQQSLERIFTPLQSLERKLRTSLSKTLDLNLPVDKIRALVSAAEEINKPLERAAKQFGQLSIEVQSGFFPALQRAQDAAIGVNNAIESTGSVSAKSFNQAKVQVDAVTQALSRLSQAQALAGRSLTGGELQFKNPLLFQTLNASAATTQKAGDLSASTLADGSIAKQVQALQQYQQAAVKAQAQLESLDLNPNVSPTVIDAQKRRIENLIETARRAQEQLQASLDFEENIGKSTPYMSTRDPSGRTLPERFAEINANEKSAAERAAAKASGSLGILSNADVEADNAKAAVERLRASVQGLSREFSDLGNKEFFDTSLVRRQEAELEMLRSIIGRVSADVRGPLENAFKSYAAAVTSALENGEKGFEDNITNVRRLRAEVIKLAAGTKQVGTIGEITGAVNRSGGNRKAGDVSRGGFDKVALAANQAAFAIDDFFSATGGVEMKLRAVQNNVTQLGFVLGGTAGLFAALGAAIGGQLLIGLGKLIGALEDTEAKERDLRERTEVLTTATENQKKAVEELAAAYDNLADRAANALNQQQQQDRQRSVDLEALKKAQKEQRENLLARFDPRVKQARQAQLRAGERIEGAATVEEQLLARRQLAAATQREQQRIGEIETRARRELVGQRDETGLVARLQAANRRVNTLSQRREFAQGAGLRTDNLDRAISLAQSERSVFLTAIRLFRDRNQVQGVEAANPVIDLATELQKRAQELGSNDISTRVGEGVQKLTDLIGEAAGGGVEGLNKLKEFTEDFAGSLNNEVAPALQAIKQRADAAAEALKEFEASANRGDSIREGLRDPAEKISQSMQDIFASFERDVLNSSGKPQDINRIRDEQQGVLSAFADQQRRQAAPALFALADSVENAVLQGPSRAALNAADISTQQGAAELARLIRGDDPAREQNLVELRKQTSELEKLNAKLDAGVAD